MTLIWKQSAAWEIQATANQDKQAHAHANKITIQDFHHKKIVQLPVCANDRKQS